MNVLVSVEAKKDIVQIRKYVRDELNNPTAATRIISLMKKTVQSLAEMPERGTPLDSILSVHTEYRFLICEKYVVFYLVTGSSVQVVRILHQLQDFMRILFNLQPEHSGHSEE